MNMLKSLKFSLTLIELVVVEYWLSDQIGMVGVAGSNPVAPNLVVSSLEYF